MTEQALTVDEATPTSPEPSFKEYSSGTVSTHEFEVPPEVEEDGDSSSQDAKPAASTDDQDVSGEPEKKGRLDRDSRFKQVIDENKQLRSQIDDLTNRFNSMGNKNDEKPTDKTFKGMTADELLDLQASDPLKYTEMIRQELLADLRNEQAQQQVEKTYKQYASENPDFEQMWNSGEIQKFLDANPGHNTISAHQMLTMERRITAAKESAAKEATDKLRADLRTKGKNAVVGQGPSGALNSKALDNQDLKNPNKFGGIGEVLRRRAAARARE